ncbi:ABC transporter permease [Cohnella yongneupensis]|uniref:ABC transporter permease n=1 Tax=Cohnella yongneupensis TaxID=425006 RepID=A0ABW0R447_9BACL
MRLYREIMLRAFQSHTTYRMDTLMHLLSSLFSILIQTTIWRALYQGNNEMASSVGNISLQEMLTYSILGSCVSIVVNNGIIGRLSQKIGSGEIAMDLIKPIRLGRYLSAESAGSTLFRLLFELVPIVAFGIAVFGLLPPAAGDLPMFALILCNSIVLFYLMNLICGLFAFWYFVSWHTQSIFGLVMSLCSGALLPLWFFPEAVSKVFGLLPFQLIYYGPISVFLGKRAFEEQLGIFGLQLIWIVLLGLLLKWIWAKAVRKLVIQGG